VIINQSPDAVGLYRRRKNEYTPKMQTEALPSLSALEQSCLTNLLEMQRLEYAIKFGIPIVASDGTVVFPPRKSGQGPAVVSLQAAADDNALPEPPMGLLQWRGTVAEVKFFAAAMDKNLGIATLIGHCYPFDAVVITKRKLYRVQVKFTGCEKRNLWQLNSHRANYQLYQAGDFDFLAVTTPDKDWFIIPNKLVRGRFAIHIPRLDATPKRHNRFAQYRERWDLFR
jgi:hypothetical protein